MVSGVMAEGTLEIWSLPFSHGAFQQLLRALLAFALADEVTEAGLNAERRFYFSSGLRGHPLVLEQAVCPPWGRRKRLRRLEHESKAELTSAGKHPCPMDSKTNFSPLIKTVEPPLFLKGSCLGHLLPVPYPASEGESFFFAKHKAFSSIPRCYQQQQLFYLFSLSARLCALCDIVSFHCHNISVGQVLLPSLLYRFIWPKFSNVCQVPEEISRGSAVYVFFSYSTEPENGPNLSLSQEQRRMSHAIQCLLRPSSSKAFSDGDDEHYFMSNDSYYSLRTQMCSPAQDSSARSFSILKAKQGRIGPFRPFSW